MERGTFGGVIEGHADGAEEQGEVIARPVSGEIPSPGGPAGETVLLLEDDAAMLESIHRALDRAGYTVLPASTTVEAIELAADHEVPISLLLTDFGLHPLTGRQVAAVLMRGRPGLRVLYVSGRTEAEVLPQGRPAAGTAFLQKPFTMEALLRQVRELLDQGRGPADAGGLPPLPRSRRC